MQFQRKPIGVQYRAGVKLSEDRAASWFIAAKLDGVTVKAALGIQLFGKKRGERRTGSRAAGTVGEAVFFGALFLLGTISLTGLLTSQVLNPTPEIYRPGVGFWLVVLVLASLMLIGGGGVLYSVAHTGASVERRSAIVRQAASLDLIQDSLPSHKDYPNVPRDERLTDSPGVKLAYRLPSELQRTAWKLATIALLSLLLSGFASVCAVLFLASLLIANANWVLLGFAIPTLALGSWSIRFLMNEVWELSRVGPTYVEISDFPLLPGNDYQVVVSQSGHSSLQSLQLSLVCEEEATYHQGTDVRVETKVVSSHPVLCRRDVVLESGSPLLVDGVLSVPQQAIHSFQSTHNAIRWKLLVEGEPESCRPFSRHFPVIIYPNRNGHHATAEGERLDPRQVEHGTADQSSDT